MVCLCVTFKKNYNMFLAHGTLANLPGCSVFGDSSLSLYVMWTSCHWLKVVHGL